MVRAVSTRRFGVRSAAAAIGALVMVSTSCAGGSDESSADADTDSAVSVSAVTAPDVEDATVESTTTVDTTTTSTSSTTTTTTTSVPDIADGATSEPADTEATGDTPTVGSTAVTTPDSESGGETDGSAGEASTDEGVAPAGYVEIVDDTGVLVMNVPESWNDTTGAPDGPLQQVAAAPDLAGFLAGYTLPGVLLIAGDAATPDAWQEGLATTVGIAQSDGCEIDETLDYDDGVYTGTEHLLSCGDLSVATHVIGGRNVDGGRFFLLAIVRSVDEPGVRDEITQSFFFD